MTTPRTHPRGLTPRFRRRRFVLPPLMILIGFGAALAPRARASEVINKMCPVMTDEEADPEITVSYRGKTVAFCCGACFGKFNADPERYRNRLPQFGGSGETITVEATEAPEIEMSFPGRLHPAIVHFPIAALPLALLGWVLRVWTGKQIYAFADLPALLVGTLAAGAAYLTGNVAEEATRFNARMHAIAERHETSATIVLITCVLLTALRLWKLRGLHDAWQWAYGAGLFVACAVVAYTGYLGGSLVFGPDHLRF